MQHFTVTKGATSTIIPVSIYDSSSTTGGKLTGLVFNTSSLTAYYNRMGASGAATAISLVTATKGTWTSGGFVAVDGTNMPGDYELHVPDAAFASGVNEVIIQLKGAANMVPVNICVHLRGVDHQDTVRAGMTALPNAAAAASGGLFVRGTGAGAINQDANGRIDVNVMAVASTSQTARDIGAAVPAAVPGANGGLPTVNGSNQVAGVSGNVAGNVTGSIGSLASQAKADVNAEVVDGLGVDTLSEMSAGAPPLLPTMRDVLNYMYRFMIRNTKKVDASSATVVETVYADDTTTPLFKRNITDSSNITTFAETITG